MTSPASSLVVQTVARGALYGAVAVLGACLFILLVLLGVAMRRAGSLRARRAASTEVRPAMQAALVAFLAGGTDDSVIRRYIQTHPTDIAESILLFQSTVGGSARDRLCGLALDLGLVHQWYEDGRARRVVRRRAAFANLAFACVYEPCRRVAGDLLHEALHDRDEEVRLSACRGLVPAGDAEQIEQLFELAIQPNLLTRIVLTEDLRHHALPLAAGPVRKALRSGDARRVRATLEILVAWERAIPLEDLREFLEHRDRDIRVLAFRLASFASFNFESRLALVRSLNDADAEIRGLAIIAVGRQKMTEAIPELALCLRREGLEQARHAAAALGGMPPQGWRTLAELSESPNPVTALAASEALARARMEP
jgi:HEAT repeat protein